MTDTQETHPFDASTARSAEPTEPWRIAWVLLGVALSALAALNAFALWIESGGSIDPEAVIASEPTFQIMFRYFGFEFMGDSLGFGALLVFSALALSRDHSNRFAWILGGSVVIWMTGTALIGLAMLSVAGAIPAAMAPGLTWSSEAVYAVFGFGLMLMNPREIESTLYFCVLEALRNTVQHAEASQATVTLTQSNGSLEFQMADDGAGFTSNTARGVGLTGMEDRLDALAGELTVYTEPGNGTTLTGTLPPPAEVTA